MEMVIELIHDACDIPQKRAIERTMGWNVMGIGKVKPKIDKYYFFGEKVQPGWIFYPGEYWLGLRLPREVPIAHPYFFYRIHGGPGYPWVKSNGKWNHGNRMREDIGCRCDIWNGGKKGGVLCYSHAVPHSDGSITEYRVAWNEESKRWLILLCYNFKRT